MTMRVVAKVMVRKGYRYQSHNGEVTQTALLAQALRDSMALKDVTVHTPDGHRLLCDRYETLPSASGCLPALSL